MSAIAGLWRLDGRPVEAEDLERLSRPLAYRGGGGSRSWRDGSSGLVALSGQPASASPTPIGPVHSEDGSLVITGDVRVDNRDELVARLELSGALNDLEIVLAAYRTWGDRCPERLLGDFAFVIWDGERRSLLCARDCFGVKPLYYAHTERLFAFASEISALLALAEVSPVVDEIRLAEYLVPSQEDTERTLYRAVRRLSPAHAMLVEGRSARTRRYWTLDGKTAIHLRSDAEYEEGFRTLFEAALRSRLGGEGSTGATLSGGLDSSSIVCVARTLSSSPLHTFSAVYPETPESDESPWIQAVTWGGGVEAHEVQPNRFGPLSCAGWDEPLWNVQLALHWALYSSAGQHGVRVLLEGEGGDEVVGHGLAHLTELALRGCWLRFARETRLLSDHTHLSLANLVRYRGLAPLVPAPLRLVRRALMGTAPHLAVPLRPEFARRIALAERLRAQTRPGTVARTAREEQRLDVLSGLNPFVLEQTDRIGARFGVEPRYPFWDRRLVEFCLALPGDQKLRHGYTRSIMRRALRDYLPPEVAERRSKANLLPSLHYSLLTHDRTVLQNAILEGPGPIADYVDMDAMRTIWERYTEHPDGDDALALWLVAVLGPWLKRVHGDTGSPAERALSGSAAS